jgi:thiol:disulfide interchange protein DsbD
VNKKIAIDIPAVREQINAQQVTTLRGDYTRKDPAIAAELRRFERAGVPLVLVYPKNPAAPPEVLPTQLTPGIVLEALQRAVQ